MNKPFKVEVVPHHLQWRDALEAESQQVADAMGENVGRKEGRTSVRPYEL